MKITTPDHRSVILAAIFGIGQEFDYYAFTKFPLSGDDEHTQHAARRARHIVADFKTREQRFALLMPITEILRSSFSSLKMHVDIIDAIERRHWRRHYHTRGFSEAAAMGDIARRFDNTARPRLAST